MLDEKDWNKINNILLELYSVRGAAALSRAILCGVGGAVPFSRGFFALFDSDGKPCLDSSAFSGFDKDSAAAVLECFRFSEFQAGKNSFYEAESSERNLSSQIAARWYKDRAGSQEDRCCSIFLLRVPQRYIPRVPGRL